MTVLGINFTDREPDRFEWQHHSHCCDATLNELNAADAAYVKIVDTGSPAEIAAAWKHCQDCEARHAAAWERWQQEMRNK